MKEAKRTLPERQQDLKVPHGSNAKPEM